MKLNLLERYTILQILPQENNLATWKIIYDLRNNLSFNEDDYKKYNIVQVEDRLNWDIKGSIEELDISIGEKAIELISNSLKPIIDKLEQDGKMSEVFYKLYIKFIKF